MKAVLVLEMPKNCEDCPLNYDYIECMGAETAIKLNYAEIPEKCPLRPLPEKRVYKDNYNRFSSQLAYEQGWNRVIEEITGEAEEIDARNKWWADHSSRFD